MPDDIEATLKELRAQATKDLTDDITVPFRFTSDEGKRLRQMTEDYKANGQMQEHISLLESAAQASERGEALHLVCSTPEELKGYVLGFRALGFDPTLDQPKETVSGKAA